MEEVLKLDLDIKNFDIVQKIVVNRCGVFNFALKGIRPVGLKVASTQHGYHIYMTVECERELSNFDVCFLQMTLGSDYKRECYNYSRFIDRLDKKWNVLFSVKYDGNNNVSSLETDEPMLSAVLLKTIEERLKREI